MWLQCAHKRSLKLNAINNHLSTTGGRPLLSSKRRKADVWVCSVKSLYSYLFLKSSAGRFLSFWKIHPMTQQIHHSPWQKVHYRSPITICHRLKERRQRGWSSVPCQISSVLHVPYQDIIHWYITATESNRIQLFLSCIKISTWTNHPLSGFMRMDPAGWLWMKRLGSE